MSPPPHPTPPYPTLRTYGLTTRTVPAWLAREDTRPRPPTSSSLGTSQRQSRSHRCCCSGCGNLGLPAGGKGAAGPGLRAGGARGRPGARPAAGEAGRRAVSLAREPLPPRAPDPSPALHRPRRRGLPSDRADCGSGRQLHNLQPPRPRPIMPAPGAAGGCVWCPALCPKGGKRRMGDGQTPTKDGHGSQGCRASRDPGRRGEGSEQTWGTRPQVQAEGEETCSRDWRGIETPGRYGGGSIGTEIRREAWSGYWRGERQ